MGAPYSGGWVLVVPLFLLVVILSRLPGWLLPRAGGLTNLGGCYCASSALHGGAIASAPDPLVLTCSDEMARNRYRWGSLDKDLS